MMLYLEYLSQGLEQGEQKDHLSKYPAKPKHGTRAACSPPLRLQMLMTLLMLGLHESFFRPALPHPQLRQLG